MKENTNPFSLDDPLTHHNNINNNAGTLNVGNGL